jgi:hypothetical protein
MAGHITVAKVLRSTTTRNARRNLQSFTVSFNGTNHCFKTWSSNCKDTVSAAKLDILFEESDPRDRERFNRYGNATQEKHPLFGQPAPRETHAEYYKKCSEWATSSRRAAARVRLACTGGTAKTIAMAVPNQSSYFDLMAALEEKIDTKDGVASGGLLHGYLHYTQTANNIQDHCVCGVFEKLVQNLA